MHRYLMVAGLVACMAGCDTLSPEPETELFPDEETRAIVDQIQKEKELGLKMVLPHLEPDWTPLWWHEQPMVAPMLSSNVSFVDIVTLVARGNVVFFDKDVQGDMKSGEGDDQDAPPPIYALPSSLETRGEIIEHLCLVYDYACVHLSNGLTVRKYDTKSYVLDVQPGNFDISSSAGGGNAGGGGGSTMQQQTNPFEALRTTLGTVVNSGDGERMEVVEDTNLLILKARPSTHAHAVGFIDEFNRRMREVIEIQVSVFELDTTKGRGFSITGNYSLADTIAGVNNLASTDYAETFESIISNAIAQQTINATYSARNASESFGIALRILNSVSNARVVFNSTIETRNNVPTETSNSRNFNLLKSIERTSERFNQESVISYEVQFEEVQTGWTVGVQPTRGEKGIINVRLGVARSDLVEVVPFDFGETQGNNFVTDNMKRLFNLTLREGESRLITSVMDTTTRTSRAPMSNLNDTAVAQFAVLVTARVTTP